MSYRPSPTVEFARVRYVREVDAQGEARGDVQGFLSELDMQTGGYEPLEQVLGAARGLVLTGGPGIGKSTELARAYDARRSEGRHAIHIDAGKVRDVAEALRRDNELDAWRQARDENLYIFIDSIDENLRPSREPVADVVTDIARALRTLPRERVFVYLAWRTLVHESGVPQAQQKLGEALAPGDTDAVRQVELAPLRREDAVHAAMQQGLDAERFLSKIDMLGIEALASRPLTLRLLLSLAGEGSLPARRAVLFERGALQLCRKPDPSRLTGREARAGRDAGTALSAEQRLAVAMRIAAVCVLAQRPFVLIRGSGAHERDAVTAAEIAGPEPRELAGDGDMEVTTQDIVDTVVENRLFDGDGSRYTWVHQEYAHFLASRYLLRHGYSEQQVRSLLGYGMDRDGLYLAPQLAGLAAWIDSEFAPAVRRTVIALDPVAQLRGDVQSRSYEDKALIVDGLLDWFENERSRDLWSLQWERNLAALAHPGLAEQLGPVLRDTGKREETRIAAATVARACQVPELMHELARIATDVAEPSYALRQAGAYAVHGSDDAEARRLLRALIHLAPTHDPDVILRSVGLGVAWQDRALDAETLFQGERPVWLRRRAGIEISGEELVARFGEDGLAQALAWLIREWGRIDSFWHDNVSESIWVKACEYLDREDIVEPMAEIIDRYLHEGRHERVARLAEQLGRNPQGRRNLLARLFARRADKEPRRAALELDDLVSRSDTPWLLDWIEEEEDEYLRHALCELVGWRVPVWEPSDEYWLIVERYRADKERYGALRDYVEWPLDSDIARKARASWLEQQEWPARETWTPEDIETRLAKVEAGDNQAWPGVIHALTLAEHSQSHYRSRREVINENGFPGWKGASPDIRARILTAGERFLRECEQDTDELRVAGIHALTLLASYAPDRLDSLPAGVWQRWAPVLATQHGPPVPDSLLAGLASRAKKHAAPVLLDVFRRLGDKDFEYPVSSRWRALWIPELAPLLAERLTQAALPPVALEQWLALMWNQAPEHARPVTDQFLARVSDSELMAEPDEAQAAQVHTLWIAAASLAIEYDAAAYWPRIWPRVHEHVPLGRRLLLKVLFGAEMRDAAPWKLSHQELANLFQWLMEKVPDIETYASFSGPAGPMPEGLILYWFSNSILEALSQCTSIPDLEVVYALRDRRPDDERVRAIVPKAEENARRHDWEPAEPGQVLRLAADPRRRLIHHSSKLAELITDIACRRVPKVYPTVRSFWERVPGDAYQPVSPSSLPSVLGGELERILAGIPAGAPIDIAPGQYADLRLRAGASPGHYSYDIAVEIALVPNWLEDPVAALDELSKKIGDADEPVHLVALLLWYDGQAWSRRKDPERYRRAMTRSADDLHTQLAGKARDIERARFAEHRTAVHITVARLDVTWSEREADLAGSMPWGRAFLDQLRAQDIEPLGFRSLGNDHHWHVALKLPDALQERFDLAPHVLALVHHGKLRWRDLKRARDDLRVAHAHGAEADGFDELDPDVLVIVDDAPDLDARLERMPGPAGQLVAWPAGDDSRLEDRLAGSLPRFDIFDVRNPVYGRRFMGRSTEVDDLQRRVMQGQSLGVFGLRKSGKTSLVRRVIDMLDPVSVASRSHGTAVAAESRILSVWLDVQGLTERSEDNLWTALHKLVRERLRLGGHQVPPASGDVYRDLPDAIRTSIEAPDTPGQWCIVLDEADLLFEGLGGEAGIPVVRLLRFLRAVSQETGRLSSVFIGRDSSAFYQPDMQGAQNPMLGWVKDYWMGTMTRADADELLERLSKRVGLALDAHHKAIARAWSGGHVLLLRQFGSALLEVSRHTSGGLAAADDQAVVDAYLDREMVRTVFEETYSLLEMRYPGAYGLLLDLLLADEPKKTLAAHDGWIGRPARTLRNFRLLTGSAVSPAMPRWLRWYGAYLGLAPETGEPSESPPSDEWSARVASMKR